MIAAGQHMPGLGFSGLEEGKSIGESVDAGPHFVCMYYTSAWGIEFLRRSNVQGIAGDFRLGGSGGAGAPPVGFPSKPLRAHSNEEKEGKGKVSKRGPTLPT